MKDAIKDACFAHTNLTMFAAVVALLESGCLYGADSNDVSLKIIRMCQAEQQRLLRQYDRAVAEIKGAVPS